MAQAMDASQPSDETLLARHREGDEAAFAELVHRYEQELFGFLLRYVRRPAVAEDLFQETFLQVHQSADSFDPSRKLRPWLFTIAANKARDHLRHMRRRQTRPLSAPFGAGEEGDGAGYLDLLEADLPLPSEGVENAETAELVRQVVSELPDHLREILLLAYFQKFSYNTAAGNEADAASPEKLERPLFCPALQAARDYAERILGSAVAE